MENINGSRSFNTNITRCVAKFGMKKAIILNGIFQLTFNVKYQDKNSSKPSSSEIRSRI